MITSERSEWSDSDDEKDRAFLKQDSHPLSASMTTFATRRAPVPLKRRQARPKSDVPHTVAATNPLLEEEWSPLFLKIARTLHLEPNEPTHGQKVIGIKLK